VVPIVASLGVPMPKTSSRALKSNRDGRIRSIDCCEIARAKRAGSSGEFIPRVRMLARPGDVVREGDPILEGHAESSTQLEFACQYAARRPTIVEYGF
jgi:thymidine phosphorylase